MNIDELESPESTQPIVSKKKAYEKPTITSHRVFEVSLACIKVPGSTMCHYNLARTRS